MLKDWRIGIEKLISAIEIEWPKAVEDVEETLSSHFSAQHQHHVASPELLAADGRAISWMKETYRALTTLEENSLDSSAVAQLDAIRTEFDGASAIFGGAVFPEIRAREQAATEKLTQAQWHADEQAAEIDRLTTELTTFEKIAVARDAQLTMQVQGLQRLTEVWAANQDVWKREIAARESELSARSDRDDLIIREIESKYQLLVNELIKLQVAYDDNSEKVSKLTEERNKAQNIIDEMQKSLGWRVASFLKKS
jgi:hypothetical protein